MKERGIILGYPYDQLFDRNCDLEHWRNTHSGEKLKRVPAIKLPVVASPGTEASPGTGNIIITGPPGSGKSTLALQWAIMCAQREDNRSNAAYFSLENTVDEVFSKAKPFGWDEWLYKVNLMKPPDEFSEMDHLDALKEMLVYKDAGRSKWLENVKGDYTRKVLLCSISPRPIIAGSDHDELFWRRYQQIEMLLRAAERLSEISDNPLHPDLFEMMKSTDQSFA